MASVTSDNALLLRAQGLRYTYPVRSGILQRHRAGTVAVDGVSFDIHSSEIVALVGESGSGKSTIGRLLLGMLRPEQGTVDVAGLDPHTVRGEARRTLRQRCQMIFQDPYSSLNPRMRVGPVIVEAILLAGERDKVRAHDRAEELLRQVQLPQGIGDRFPHELSGGQRQRVGIARALATNPRLLVADEALASLDVSIQAQIAQLLLDLRSRYELSMLFITHDLAMARRLADRVIVLHKGRIVEEGSAAQVIDTPVDPYTRALIDAVPIADPELARRRQADQLATAAQHNERMT